MRRMSGRSATIIGLEECLDATPAGLRHGQVALLMNQASVDRRFRYAHDLLAQRFPGRLTVLFSPQHGLWSEQQDNMIETADGCDDRLGIPIRSLYSDTRKPTRDALRGIDLFVIDLQDVGTRVYTFAWTVSYCLEACAQAGVPVLVLDRPNPIGGNRIEGRMLDPAYASFVGRAAIPMRHGLTIAELSLLLNDALDIRAEIAVMPMSGWRRSMLFPETGREWVPTSPNLPRFAGVAVYPGQVILEGTNLSEGRGTTTPFEVCGAPYVDPSLLLDRLERFELRGVAFRRIRFVPTFQKWAGQSCGGLFLHVVDPQLFQPYRTSLAIVAAVAALWPDAFAWRQPPYEYERHKAPIDILTGSADFRLAVDSGAVQSAADLDPFCDTCDWSIVAERYHRPEYAEI